MFELRYISKHELPLFFTVEKLKDGSERVRKEHETLFRNNDIVKNIDDQLDYNREIVFINNCLRWKDEIYRFQNGLPSNSKPFLR